MKKIIYLFVFAFVLLAFVGCCSTTTIPIETTPFETVTAATTTSTTKPTEVHASCSIIVTETTKPAEVHASCSIIVTEIVKPTETTITTPFETATTTTETTATEPAPVETAPCIHDFDDSHVYCNSRGCYYECRNCGFKKGIYLPGLCTPDENNVCTRCGKCVEHNYEVIYRDEQSSAIIEIKQCTNCNKKRNELIFK